MTQKRALLSVSDKRGLVDFARRLEAADVELVASGGTAHLLREAGIPVSAVETVTGFPEILGGRVKTLHPAIHGAILARRTPAHLSELSTHNLAPIDLVVVNLYPFEQTISRPDVDFSEAIEQIDIGGVALLRAAAKNHEAITVVCDPDDYGEVAQAFGEDGSSTALRTRLALKAFQHTAQYDVAISDYLARHADQQSETDASQLPDVLHLQLCLRQRNRYGENPHQQGGLYRNARTEPCFDQVHGKEMSYNNWLDLDGSWRAAQDFPAPTVAIIKHGNPCGLASGATLVEAYDKALASDSVSAFGSVISVNRPLDMETAERMGELFVEVVAAPAFNPDARAKLARKKNIRLLVGRASQSHTLSLRSVVGGVLVQEPDVSQADMAPANWTIVSQKQPTDEQMTDLAFAWRAARHVKSNAIVYVRDEATVGIGAGQMSRVDSVMVAGHKARDRAKGAVMASDAFFPFADGIEAAAEHGVAAVVQPGGSVRDGEVIKVADQLGLVMAFTSTRHFKH